jgi:hypothetical protein
MDNKRAAMLLDEPGNGGDYLVAITNNTNGGGIKFIPGISGGMVVDGFQVRNRSRIAPQLTHRGLLSQISFASRNN